jgi:S-DNA-T family DNA segregation ATPase FtsK/SpoIIIE
MMLYVTGFDMAELRAIRRFLLLGLLLGYNALASALGQGARSAVSGAMSLQDRARSRAAAVPPVSREMPGSRRMMPPVTAGGAGAGMAPEPLRSGASRAMPAATRAEPSDRAAEPARERTSFLSRLRRQPSPEPELVEPDGEALWDAEMPGEDRIRARISDVIRARVQRVPDPMASAPILRAEPPVMRPRGPAPLLADTRPLPRMAPPVTAAPARDLAEDEDSPRNIFAEDRAWDDAGFEDELDDLPDAAPAPRQPGLAADRRVVVQQAARKPAPSRQALAETQPGLRFDDSASAYELPPLGLLSAPVAIQRSQLSNEALEENARMLESVLDDYGVKGEITAVRPGPVVTMYELEPAPGLKASRVIGLADDIARSMSALSARVSTVPGRTVIGIELPNAIREKVVLREIISARDFGDSQMRLPLALGKDIGGEPVVANLAKMPHLLIAGTTGSGKSVAINTMILSLLYKLTPEECRMIMIDPKMLELSVYDGIPHLLSPVVTDPKKAVVALKWVVSEMEERYRKMSKMGVRNIEGYNGRVREALSRNEMFKRTIQTGFDDETGDPVFETEEFQPVTLPYIVVIVDEMADLMMVAGKEIEACIQRLAQMARASGIHLIMATQRPSVDVITGTIKANFPTRISFQVTSKIDSRTILGEQGAEQLLGMGDMLYMGNGAKITRIHGPFVSDEEVEEIVNHLKSFGPPVYMSGVVEGPEDEVASDIDMVLGLGSGEASDDQLYDQAVAIVARDRKCSTSYIQRKLGIGYNKAARLVEQMEDQGVVTRANHVGKREILVPEA